jgi:hypothetical protein
MACQLSLAALHCRVGHSYATNAGSAWTDWPSTRFGNEIGKDPAPAASVPSRCAVQIIHVRAIEDSYPSPSRPYLPFRTTARIFPVMKF